MPSKPQLRERCDRPGSYYVQIGRRRINLGRDREEAERQYHAILASQPQTGQRIEVSASMSVRELFDRFLSHKRAGWTAQTFTFNEIHLTLFAEFVGARAATKTLPIHVEEWILAAGWTNPNTVGNAKRVPKAAFRWAVEMGILASNPLASLRKPTPRARDFVLDPEQQDEFFRRIADDPLRDIATFMLNTGARPQEARAVTAAEFVVAESVLFWPAGKAPKGHAPRRIYLAGDALEIVRRLSAEHPDEPIFRMASGRPWRRDDLSRAFAVHADAMGLPSFVPYTLRHTYATNALANGVDPERLRILLGHRDLAMVIRYYSKLDQRRDEIRVAADQAIGKRKAAPRRRR